MPKIKIILVTPPPVEETRLIEHLKKKYNWEGPPHITAATVAKYAKEAIKVRQLLKAAAEKDNDDGLPEPEILDVWGEFISRTGWQGGTLPGSKESGLDKTLAELLVDGVHLTATGYQIVCSALYELIKAKYPEQVRD